MWTRKELKDRAKQTLKGHYWTAFLASLVLTFATGGGGSASGASGSGGRNADGWLGALLQRPEFTTEVILGISVATLLLIAFDIFVTGALQVGGRRYFTSACCRQYDLSNLGFGFRRGHYWNIVKTHLLTNLRLLGWTLLFIIPGIVKSIAYSMVPYILADNPYLNPKRVIELSCRMTDGHKGEIFGLGLSFVGWYLLGSLCCGVGILFVNPYLHSTMAELYMQLRHQALQRGDTTMEELCLSYN